MSTADPFLVPYWTPPAPVADGVELFLFDLDHGRAHDEAKPHVRRHAVGRRILLHLLGRRLDVLPETIELASAPGGKPLLKTPQSQLAFNISYSRRWLAAAIAPAQGDCVFPETRSEFTLGRVLPTSPQDTLKRELRTQAGQIGVDVEMLDPTIDAMQVARDHFHANELAHLQSLAPADRPLAFYRFWTAKEAVLKSLGTGLSLDPRQVEIELGDAPRLLSPEYNMRLAQWQIPALGDTLILTLAHWNQ